MYELSEEVKMIGEHVIEKNEKFQKIKDYGVKIAYVFCDRSKKSNGNTVFADCAKISDKNKVLSGYDFCITFYGNSLMLTDDKRDILMEHELMHIGIDNGGCYIVPHDLSDFKDIVEKYGVNWVDDGVN